MLGGQIYSRTIYACLLDLKARSLIVCIQGTTASPILFMITLESILMVIRMSNIQQYTTITYIYIFIFTLTQLSDVCMQNINHWCSNYRTIIIKFLLLCETIKKKKTETATKYGERGKCFDTLSLVTSWLDIATNNHLYRSSKQQPQRTVSTTPLYCLLHVFFSSSFFPLTLSGGRSGGQRGDLMMFLPSSKFVKVAW